MSVLYVRDLHHGPIQGLSADWSAGVHGVCGEEAGGKTTLLRLLAGELKPAAGEVFAPEGGVFWVDLQGDLAEALGMHAHLDKRMVFCKRRQNTQAAPGSWRTTPRLTTYPWRVC
jgi:ABC-type transport system involved in cytochrome c biogenesis ATPase subunit